MRALARYIARFFLPILGFPTKYTASTHGKELEEGNQEEKNDQRHDVGNCTDFIFRRFNLKEIQLYSLTRSTLYSEPQAACSA